MKIAVIGSGIAGNVTAHHLAGEHSVTVFEAGDHLGGHTRSDRRQGRAEQAHAFLAALAAGADAVLLIAAVLPGGELARLLALAHELGMSVSSFHHHFKAVTALSPLQFQKRLRLQEARRLMLGEDLDAADSWP